MIDPKKNPVEWAQLCYELEEAKEHLESLLSDLDPEQGIDDTDFQVKIFHIITHLNRVYNSRHHVGEISGEEFKEYSELPSDFSATG